ncbi:hypothetical protein Ae505Ps2_5085 [Pseudonocardia sp. Ae505_Ps2]|nr:hypothetical protein Ae505Ps2_5085 [Pseudonocardia sp. Ae505_Ps2]
MVRVRHQVRPYDAARAPGATMPATAATHRPAAPVLDRTVLPGWALLLITTGLAAAVVVIMVLSYSGLA